MRRSIIVAALGLVIAGLVIVQAPSAQAADVLHRYGARTGGTQVKVFDGTVNSDFTAQSEVSGLPDSSASKNSTLGVEVDGLVRVGAVETRTTATVEPTLTTLTSFARTANVNLLNGLITADAVETNVTTVGRSDGTQSSTGGTKLLNIKIAGVDLPVKIPKNYSVRIPGVATVSLNTHVSGKSDGTVTTIGRAIAVTLLEPRAGYAAGTTVLVNPVVQFLVEAVPAPGATLYGGAYGTRALAEAGDRVRIYSDRTALVGTPLYSSNGKTLKNQLLGVNVPGLLTTGAVTSTSYSTRDTAGNAVVQNTNQIANLNILGGLITADALKVAAHGRVQDGVWSSRLRMTTLDLVVAGQQIPVDVSRNTVIDVAGLGQVAINLQQKGPAGSRWNRIDGIRITLDTERAGLPVGAVIEVGVAETLIRVG